MGFQSPLRRGFSCNPSTLHLPSKTCEPARKSSQTSFLRKSPVACEIPALGSFGYSLSAVGIIILYYAHSSLSGYCQLPTAVFVLPVPSSSGRSFRPVSRQTEHKSTGVSLSPLFVGEGFPTFYAALALAKLFGFKSQSPLRRGGLSD